MLGLPSLAVVRVSGTQPDRQSDAPPPREHPRRCYRDASMPVHPWPSPLSSALKKAKSPAQRWLQTWLWIGRPVVLGLLSSGRLGDLILVRNVGPLRQAAARNSNP